MKSCDKRSSKLPRKCLVLKTDINSMVPTMEGRSIKMFDYVGMLVTDYGGCLHQTMNVGYEFMNTDS